MSIKRHLTALFHRERCERDTLIPMLEKLNEQERMALSKLSAGDALGTDFILDGVLGGEISMSHAHKLRSDLMRALNKKILELTNISEVIIAQKHQTDRRIKRYIIDPKYLHLFRNMDQQSEST